MNKHLKIPVLIIFLLIYAIGITYSQTEQYKFRHLTTKQGLPSNAVNSIIKDQDGFMWFGTDNGLVRYDGYSVVTFQILGDSTVESENQVIEAILEDTEGNLWVGTLHNGLQLFDRITASFTSFIHDPEKPGSLSHNRVNTIYQDIEGVLWIGTNGGLNRFDIKRKEFSSYLHEANNPDNPKDKVYAIFEDKAGAFWIGTAKGVYWFNRKKESFTKFDLGQEIPGIDYRRVTSFIEDRNGMMWIGTHWGMYKYDINSKEIINYLPADFKVFANDMNEGSVYLKKVFVETFNIFVRSIVQNFFTFEFAALDYINPGKNQYAYWLEGLEDDWIYSGNQRWANYTGVPPGEYIFRVKGSNNDGLWNEEGTVVHISILPPVWETWWAYAVYGLAIIAVIYFIIRFYLRRQRLLNNLALELIETEKLKELDGLKTRFFTNISHEFRTPLTLILGPLQQLISKVNKQSDKQVLSMVLQNADRLKDLVNQLLSLAKLESGKIKLQCSKTNIVEFTRNYVQSFESLASLRNISLVFTTDAEAIDAYIDREKTEQVLNNLLSNAFKFTQEGGKIEVSVYLPTRRPPEANKFVVIAIIDTGCGITPKKLPHIFNRFYQVDDSMSREHEGTGIGLAIVKEMVTLHHGNIEVASEVGVGTVFSLYLPLGKDHLKDEQIVMSRQATTGSQQVEDNIKTSHVTSHKSQVASQPGPNVSDASHLTEKDAPILLIVEDNANMRTFIRTYFENTYQILEAENGQEGMSMAIDHIPDIIISDVMMPKMDGYEYCKKIKTDERTSHIPVILLTARASKESRLEGLETGADDFITKPFDGEELEVRVKNLIDQRKILSEHWLKEFEVIRENRKEKIFSMEEKFLQKARLTVEKNLSNPDYGVENFASDMALSRSQLHRKLNALVNQPITEFIRTIRLNYAVGLLKKRAGTISEIAYDAGFNNPTWFSISFKKHYGISPSEYLKQLER